MNGTTRLLQKAMKANSTLECVAIFLVALIGSFVLLFRPFFNFFYRGKTPAMPIYYLAATLGAVILVVGIWGTIRAMRLRERGGVAIFGVALAIALIIFATISSAVRFGP
jgi:hypothetical protein